MNYDAIDAGAKQVVEVAVPESWKDAADEGLVMTYAEGGRKDVVDFVNNIQSKVNAQEGNTLPVSAFKDYVDGTTPSGSSAYEKRGIAVDVPVWQPRTVFSVTTSICMSSRRLSVRCADRGRGSCGTGGNEDSADDRYAELQVRNRYVCI